MKKEPLWTMETELGVVVSGAVVDSDPEMEGNPQGWLEVQRTSWATDLLQETAFNSDFSEMRGQTHGRGAGGLNISTDNNAASSV